MSKSGQPFVAATQWHQFTEFQAYLEKTYPAVIEKEGKGRR